MNYETVKELHESKNVCVISEYHESCLNQKSVNITFCLDKQIKNNLESKSQKTKKH